MKYLFLLGTALAVSTPAFADESADPIVVTATREPTPATQVGQPVSVVTRDEIERTQAATALDVLARLPVVAFTQSGGFGPPASVFIRGTDLSPSLVLIDGLTVNRLEDSRVG